MISPYPDAWYTPGVVSKWYKKYKHHVQNIFMSTTLLTADSGILHDAQLPRSGRSRNSRRGARKVRRNKSRVRDTANYAINNRYLTTDRSRDRKKGESTWEGRVKQHERGYSKYLCGSAWDAPALYEWNIKKRMYGDLCYNGHLLMVYRKGAVGSILCRSWNVD